MVFLWLLSAKGKDDSSRVDRVQWKGMVNTMQDTTKFVDMLHNVSWVDGLPDDVLKGKCISSKCPYTERV